MAASYLNPVALKVGIIAPCSVVPQVELELGVDFLKQHGFVVHVHPQCFKQHLSFAGTHENRARAFFEYAMSPDVDVLWAARGGYGANHLLPWLDRLSQQNGKPQKKLLVGYSDITALFEYCRTQWGW